MKILNYMNIFLVGISIILIALGFITKESSGNLIGYGLMFTPIIGLFQVVSGVSLLFYDPKDNMLKWYLSGVCLFFFCWICNSNIIYMPILEFTQFALPPILAIYFSVLIYKKANI
ncbi:hypothetical protein [Flavobacterium gyeonganense]|uniref:DoxX-like protein n=1 Tax=Flavobacterium gyeonganense TaxID=1310418 RepID=A0ABV5H7P0_9FLAO|nr:hypothetical protein [Flavobacterium gyeonganense]